MGRFEPAKSLEQPLGDWGLRALGDLAHRRTQVFGLRPIAHATIRANARNNIEGGEPPPVSLRVIGIDAVDARFKKEVPKCRDSQIIGAVLRAQAHEPLAEFGHVNVEPLEVVAEAGDFAPELGTLLAGESTEPARQRSGFAIARS
jgi:hypothetical protein